MRISLVKKWSLDLFIHVTWYPFLFSLLILPIPERWRDYLDRRLGKISV
jgi:hypothetical protein